MSLTLIRARRARPLEVVIAGGGVAGLEALLALHELAGPRVKVELLAPEREFVYRPLAVAEPFGLAHPARDRPGRAGARARRPPPSRLAGRRRTAIAGRCTRRAAARCATTRCCWPSAPGPWRPCTARSRFGDRPTSRPSAACSRSSHAGRCAASPSRCTTAPAGPCRCTSSLCCRPPTSSRWRPRRRLDARHA